MSPPLAFIDFEASSLDPESWPLEAGYALSTGKADGFLIQRAEKWSMQHWDRRSALIHGISLKDLEADGLPADVALRRLAWALEDVRVVSDAPTYDMHWLETLADAAGQPVPFEIHDWEAALPRLKSRTWDGVRREAERLSPRVHRARADACAMRETWRLAWEAAHAAWGEAG
jgi:hypothetical protein